MKICKNCGAQVNDDSRFCTKCGADTMAGGDDSALTEASAAPLTDERPPAVSADQSGVYYQPPTENGGKSEAEPTTPYSYGATSEYHYEGEPVPQKPAKKRLPVWSIILIVIAAIGIVIRIGLFVLDFVDVDTVIPSAISDGEVSEGVYINNDLGIKADFSDPSKMALMNDEELKFYGFTDGDVEYEFVAYDKSTGETLSAYIVEGSVSEAMMSMDEFVSQTVEYAFDDDENCEISEIFEKEIAGKTFTCAKVSQTVQEEGYEPYYMEQTLCIIREGKSFFELLFTIYPEETGSEVDDMTATYFSEYAE